MRGAVAIFVKTPRVSPVKTRLARSIGEEAAEEFYLASVRAVAAVAQRDSDAVDVYFAVAEEDGMESDLWKSHPRLSQGEGGLGARLDAIYRQLLDTHGFGILIGGDAPQLEASVLRDAAEWLVDHEARFAWGPAADGGFWLFGGNRSVPTSTWTSVRYSQPATGRDLRSSLVALGSIKDLPQLRDVDEVGDLRAVLRALRALPSPLPEQVELAASIERLLAPL